MWRGWLDTWWPVSEKEIVEYKPVEICLKIDLVSHPAHVDGLAQFIVLLEIDLVSHHALAEGLGKYIVLLKIDLVSHHARAEGLGKYIVL